MIVNVQKMERRKKVAPKDTFEAEFGRDTNNPRWQVKNPEGQVNNPGQQLNN